MVETILEETKEGVVLGVEEAVIKPKHPGGRPKGIYKRKDGTTREQLLRRIPRAFLVLDRCLKNGKGISTIQLSAAKWIIENDLTVEKAKPSDIIPDYEKELLKNFKEGDKDAIKEGKQSESHIG